MSLGCTPFVLACVPLPESAFTDVPFAELPFALFFLAGEYTAHMKPLHGPHPSSPQAMARRNSKSQGFPSSPCRCVWAMPPHQQSMPFQTPSLYFLINRLLQAWHQPII